MRLARLLVAPAIVGALILVQAVGVSPASANVHGAFQAALYAEQDGPDLFIG
jgi:hypothetical protein